MSKNVRIGLVITGLLFIGLWSAMAWSGPVKRVLVSVRRPTLVTKPITEPVAVSRRIYPATRPVEVLARVDSTAEKWIDSVFTTMTPEQKVGQFFMVATFSNRHEIIINILNI